MGGLANQMFQYSVGRALSLRHNTELMLDLSFFQNQNNYTTKREYGLHAFNIKALLSENINVRMIGGNRLSKIYLLKYKTLKSFTKDLYLHVREKSFTYDSEILMLPDNIYLEGYWQSEKYFKHIESIIRNDFTYINETDSDNLKILNRIKGSESIAIHFRRGDYINNRKTNEVHGICSMEYYNSAVDYIAQKVSSPYFFIYSDVIEWVKRNLSIKYNKMFVDINTPEKASNDLRLISNCKHQIIANSSFSWWGAWLNQNPEKIVIAPKKWFMDEKRNTSDLIPEKWIRL